MCHVCRRIYVPSPKFFCLWNSHTEHIYGRRKTRAHFVLSVPAIFSSQNQQLSDKPEKKSVNIVRISRTRVKIGNRIEKCWPVYSRRILLGGHSDRQKQTLIKPKLRLYQKKMLRLRIQCDARSRAACYATCMLD